MLTKSLHYRYSLGLSWGHIDAIPGHVGLILVYIGPFSGHSMAILGGLGSYDYGRGGKYIQRPMYTPRLALIAWPEAFEKVMLRPS